MLPAAESRVTALQNAPPTKPLLTLLTSLCGAQGQLVMFIASASDQRPSALKRKGESERKAERGRERDRWGGVTSKERKREEASKVDTIPLCSSLLNFKCSTLFLLLAHAVSLAVIFYFWNGRGSHSTFQNYVHMPRRCPHPVQILAVVSA